MTSEEAPRLRVPIAIGAAMGAVISILLAVTQLAPVGPSHAVLAAAVATPYLAFAAHDGRTSAVIIEWTVVTGFIVAALVLLDGPILAVAAVLAGHGVWDFAHAGGRICKVVPWWPPWCAALDITAAVMLVTVDALLL